MIVFYHFCYILDLFHHIRDRYYFHYYTLLYFKTFINFVIWYIFIMLFLDFYYFYDYCYRLDFIILWTMLLCTQKVEEGKDNAVFTMINLAQSVCPSIPALQILGWVKSFAISCYVRVRHVTETVQAVGGTHCGRIVVVGALTRCAFLHSVRDLKAARLNAVQRSLRWELSLYVFELDHNAADATKNICGAKGEGHSRWQYSN